LKRTFLILGFLIFVTSCERRVQVLKDMIWTCLPENDFRDNQWVRFSYSENPNYHADVAGPRLCDELKRSGKVTVKMRIDLMGDLLSGFRGSNAVQIEGLPVAISQGGGGFTSSGLGGPGKDPLQVAYDEDPRNLK